jgi:hypothetical protein
MNSVAVAPEKAEPALARRRQREERHKPKEKILAFA